MKNLIFLIFLAAVIFLIVGWFQDWYSFGGVKNASGKTSIQFEVDTNKIKSDISKGTDKLHHTIDQVRSDEPSKSAPQSGSWVWKPKN